MTRATSRVFLVFVAGLAVAGLRISGQGAAPVRPAGAGQARPAATSQGTFVASTKNGDWPSYTGDTRGSRGNVGVWT